MPMGYFGIYFPLVSQRILGDKSKIIAGHFLFQRIDDSQTSVFSFVLYLTNAWRSGMNC